MKRLIILGAVLVLVPAVNAWAERCIGPMDTSDLVVTTYGVTPFNTSDIVWCDDFDTYCGANRYATPNPIYWPGYPPSPDATLCTSATDGSEWWMKTCNCIDHLNWDKDWGGLNFGITSASDIRLEGWDGNPGWATLPFVSVQSGNQNPVPGRAYYDFDMTGAIGHKFSGSNAVNGTDLAPLVLRYWLNDNVGLSQQQQPAWGKPPPFQIYMELNMSPDRTPVDYVMAADTISQCVSEGVNWPIICQQNPSGAPPGLPANCPDIGINPRPIHNSLAFGWVAALDLNPCDVDTGRNPTMYHAATFDGQQWFRLISNQHPGGGDFNYGMQQAFFEMTIRSTTYDVRLIAPLSCINDGCPNPPGYTIATNTATGLTRHYTGSFDRVSMGAGLGCELDPANPWQCKTGSIRSTAPWNWEKSDNAFVDRPVLFGGSGNRGVCCHKDATCTPDVLPGDCIAVGDQFKNALACEDVLCCPYPFADADHDGDVDQDDFGAFQVCYTGTAGGVPTGCTCFDRNDDGNIDDTDFQSFFDCWTGPNVQYSVALPPSCTP